MQHDAGHHGRGAVRELQRKLCQQRAPSCQEHLAECTCTVHVGLAARKLYTPLGFMNTPQVDMTAHGAVSNGSYPSPSAACAASAIRSHPLTFAQHAAIGIAPGDAEEQGEALHSQATGHASGGHRGALENVD